MCTCLCGRVHRFVGSWKEIPLKLKLVAFVNYPS